jgi:hypothetical protein
MKINGRRRKNHIHRLKDNNGWVTDHVHKEKLIFDHFEAVMAKVGPTTRISLRGRLILRGRTDKLLSILSPRMR